MQALELDFRRNRPASAWVGPLLLAIAVAFALDVGFSYGSLKNSLHEKESRVARAAPSARAAAKVTPEEIALARETVQRLSLPWDGLFSALESAASDQVALLAIEPDARSGTVVISGTSKDYLAALTYVLNLSRDEKLGRVQLVRHEVKQNEPQRPVVFAVSASWMQGK
jgi:Tfp pilus assembly protein PilN